MQRRSFLKLVASAIGLTMVPEVLSTLGPGDPVLAFNHPSTDYRLAVVTKDGRLLWAPKVKAVSKTMEYPEDLSSVKHLDTKFEAEAIDVEETLTVVKARLIDPEGRTVGEQVFGQDLFVLPMDQLKVTYTMTPL